MGLAPVILFVYNRPWHTEQTLNALKNNMLAKESILYIYSDGPKTDLPEELENIQKLRTLLRHKKWCKEVIIKERELNLGLANSVIEGVSEVIEEYGNVIVLEDDIVTSPDFLKYMNDALSCYEHEMRVYGISGYAFPAARIINDETYFLPIMSSWGYATWLNRWDKINFDAGHLIERINGINKQEEFNFGYFNYYKMLKLQVAGKIDSWAVPFNASMFLNNGCFLYPKHSQLVNIGKDGSGTHFKDPINVNTTTVNAIEFKAPKIIVKQQPVVLKYKNVNIIKVGLNRKTKVNSKILKSLKKYLAPEFKSYIKRKLQKSREGKEDIDIFKSLKKIPRYTQTIASIEGRNYTIPDSASFIFMYREIFKTQIYKFETQSELPYVIDGGANIGLATIYFKSLFPDAEIVAFEPDPYIFEILENNIKNNIFDNIILINKGLWKEDTNLKFKTEGADAGSLNPFNKYNEKEIQTVSVTSLRPYLQKTVHFLKLDIEGAETVVLKDINKELNNVERIFVEYHSFVGQEQSLDEIITILKEAKFRLYITSPGVSSKSPFVDLNVYLGMDLQLNIYGIKEI